MQRVMKKLGLYLDALLDYGVRTGILPAADVVYAQNRLLEALALNEMPERMSAKNPELHPARLEGILSALCDYAVAAGLIPEDSQTRRDLFDTKLMGCLTPPPSTVIARFNADYRHSPKAATDAFYRLSQDTDYIRRYRMIRDIRWLHDAAYGGIDITINLAKPEKDPRDIAAAATIKAASYPKCMLCREAEGYAGHLGYPARQNHRVIPIMLDEEPWFFQYSPYVYYNEHCIALNQRHIPMRIDASTFRKLADFIDLFPHYFIGSNADLPIVGGSILSHDHFQGGRYEFAMARAPIESSIRFKDFPGTDAGIVNWPLSVIRLRNSDRGQLIALAECLLAAWREYSDPEVSILAYTGHTPHNTVTPIMRKRGAVYELDLALRNNRTTPEHPLGLFHPHADLHNIKKENIGLIEVMGLAVLPARLVRETALLKEYLIEGKNIRRCAEIAHHADWAERVLSARIADAQAAPELLTAEEIEGILREEIGNAFVRVLEDAGVFKRDAEGKAAFRQFLRSVGGETEGA